MLRQLILCLGFIALCGTTVCAQQAGLIPASMQIRTDKKGNQWYVEQNGQLSRQGGANNSILSGAMTLTLGTEQFYCNQAMSTPDGKELVLIGAQPMQGLQVTRQIRFLEKEGGMRYLELINNPTATDITTAVELRNNFSGQVKSFVTDSGRVNNGALEKDETSIVAVPGTANATGFLFTVCGPNSPSKPRINTQNQYQFSFFYNVVVPAGKTIGILHTVTQDKLAIKPAAPDIGKILKPFSLIRQLKDLPKGSSALLVNLRAGSAGVLDFASWFPEEILGIKRLSTDVLAMGEGTRLLGRASCAKLTLEHPFGNITIPWEKVIAITGGRFEGGNSRVYLNDGQLLIGKVSAEELKIVLSTGLPMTLKIEELDRLVLGGAGTPEWPQQVAALVEMSSGERYALRDITTVSAIMATSWGARTVPLGELASLAPGSEESGTPVATLKDGSRLRVWLGSQESLPVTTLLFGLRNLESARIRAIAVSGSVSTDGDDDDDDGDPRVAFAELAGDQRLVASLAGGPLQVVTAGGVVPLEPGSIKELRNVTEDVQMTAADEDPWFQIDLWGGGSVLGQVRDSAFRFQVGAGEWIVPGREITRLVNPVPQIAEATLNRIAQLIRELGAEDWKVRERSTGELKNFGEMARTALQEAFKQSEDAEVKHRIENLLSELD